MLALLRDDGAVEPDGRRQPCARRAARGPGATSSSSRGYHNTRVDDLVAAAGVSHGAFYRYFRNKDELARMLDGPGRAGRGRTRCSEIPDVATLEAPTGKAALRRWLRRYHAAHANEAAMLRVWVDAAVQDPALRAESAPLLDWGRRRMARYLRPRGFGDVDIEAVVMVALLGVFGARPATAGRGRRRRARSSSADSWAADCDGSTSEHYRLRRHRLLPGPDICQDPYPYYEYLRAHGPVWREPHRGVVMVTGFEEAMSVYNDPATFSSCNTVSGTVGDGGRCRSRATTSARSSSSTATRCRSATSCRRSTRRSTPRTAGC